MNACFRAAIPISLIPSGATAFELEHLFRTSEATRLFAHSDILPNALDTARKFGVTDDRIYALDGHIEGRTSLDAAIREVRNRKVARVPCRPANRDTLAYLVYSSGTSGLPKGELLQCRVFPRLTRSLAVMVSHRNIIASLIQVAVATEAEGPNPILEVGHFEICRPHPSGLPRAFMNAPMGRRCMRVLFNNTFRALIRTLMYASDTRSNVPAADHRLHVFPCG